MEKYSSIKTPWPVLQVSSMIILLHKLISFMSHFFFSSTLYGIQTQCSQYDLSKGSVETHDTFNIATSFQKDVYKRQVYEHTC